ncbi:MAG TPA: SRPBCC domain-containing protein [Streptosporangiaceae bacterium]|nr:SRPBCC domain-containing protein [Streptosporangiaceae bacterium]
MGYDNDRIEQDIMIAAPPERVWALVAQPGFWVIPDGGTIAAPGELAEAREGSHTVSEHPGYGSYPVIVVRSDPPRYIAYRWASAFPGQEPGQGNSTLIEFTLSPEGAATRLRVTESGFARLTASEVQRRKALDDNTEGWAKILQLARGHIEQLPQ